MEWNEIKADLKKKLKNSRYVHTLGVVKTAEQLAKCYSADDTQARLAALLHDCAKYLPDAEKIALCKAHHVAISAAEQQNPALLHAKCGAIVAKRDYGIADEKILHAISVHTTGVPQMNLLDKIVFVADYIEPNRTEAPHLEELRQLALTDLNTTVALILEDTIHYLNQRSDQTMDPTTYQAYLYYNEQKEGNMPNE